MVVEGKEEKEYESQSVNSGQVSRGVAGTISVVGIGVGIGVGVGVGVGVGEDGEGVVQKELHWSPALRVLTSRHVATRDP